MEKINSNIQDLEPNFKNKIIDFLKEVRVKYPNVDIFEWLRSKKRQEELYSIGRRWIAWEKPVTWTMNSKHLEWKAVDIIFKDSKWNPTWNWDYKYLIEIAKKYWINNLAPTEVCHFECDWTSYNLKSQWQYEAMFINKYWINWTIYNDLSVIDKLIKEWNTKELTYLLLIGIERIKKTP